MDLPDEVLQLMVVVVLLLMVKTICLASRLHEIWVRRLRLLPKLCRIALAPRQSDSQGCRSVGAE